MTPPRQPLSAFPGQGYRVPTLTRCLSEITRIWPLATVDLLFLEGWTRQHKALQLTDNVMQLSGATEIGGKRLCFHRAKATDSDALSFRNHPNMAIGHC